MFINISDDLLRLHALGVLDSLLADRTTGHNILWATDAYCELGSGYERDREITSGLITGENASVIRTRARRTMEQQSRRTRRHGEVSTPLWVCGMMNDYLDRVWFRRKAGINRTDGQGRILFPKGRTWRHYTDDRRMELTCGEAPYLATRYDPETGEAVPLPDRSGILDRKLRAVSENARTEAEWLEWALRAVQACYGYEYQGDSLLIGRVNVLMTFEEYLRERWGRRPTGREYKTVSRVVSWNLIQMDGLTGMIPFAIAEEEQLSLFPSEPRPPSVCRFYNWRQQRSVEYRRMKEAKARMKFDYIIGNPPYQDETEGTSDIPVYNDFMDAAYDIGCKVELITPARFLFDAGKTPKTWNRKMLNDKHLKVLTYFQDAREVFPNNLVNGGVAITYHDSQSDFGAIGVFSQYSELNTILNKVKRSMTGAALDSIISQQNKWNLDALYADYPEYKELIGSNGREKRLTTSIFTSLAVFREEKGSSDTPILGLINGKRCYRYLPTKYLDSNHKSFEKWKVIISSGDGAAGTIGLPIPARVSGVPSILKPFEGYTQTFIGFGAFETAEDAFALEKYIKTKFARTMLATLKVTQHNHKDTWANVPLQDFTPSSDIDWSKSIPEIDQQLYAKYGLDAAEIEFIETHVKEMS